MVQRNKAVLKLFVAHEWLAEAVEPAMANLNNPAPCFFCRITLLDCAPFATADDMWDVVAGQYDLQRRLVAAPRG